MITLTADKTTIALPNPKLDDSENLTHDLTIKRTLGGEKYTYVKTKTRRRLVMSFRMSFQKAKELRIFVQSYISKQIVLRDHLGAFWKGYITNNPVESEGLKDDDQETQIIFEGVKS